VFRFHLKAISFDVDDADALADFSRSAARRPFAVADTDTAAVGVDGLYDDNDLAEQPCYAIVEERI